MGNLATILRRLLVLAFGLLLSAWPLVGSANPAAVTTVRTPDQIAPTQTTALSNLSEPSAKLKEIKISDAGATTESPSETPLEPAQQGNGKFLGYQSPFHTAAGVTRSSIDQTTAECNRLKIAANTAAVADQIQARLEQSKCEKDLQMLTQAKGTQKVLGTIGIGSDVAAVAGVGAEAYSLFKGPKGVDQQSDVEALKNLAKLRKMAGKTLVGAGVVDVGIGMYGRMGPGTKLKNAGERGTTAYDANKKASTKSFIRGAAKAAGGVAIMMQGKGDAKRAEEMESAIPTEAEWDYPSGSSVSYNPASQGAGGVSGSGIVTNSVTLGDNPNASNTNSGTTATGGGTTAAALSVSCVGGGCSAAMPEADSAPSSSAGKSISPAALAHVSATRSLASLSGSIDPVSPAQMVPGGGRMGASVDGTSYGGAGGSRSYSSSEFGDLAVRDLAAADAAASMTGIHPDAEVDIFAINSAQIHAVFGPGGKRH